MSLDKPRARENITKEIHDRELDKQKRLKVAGEVRDDKKIEAETAKKLTLGGTLQGAEAVKKAVSEAAKETDKEHEKQSENLDKQVFRKAKATESEMQKRSDHTKEDIQDISAAITSINTTDAMKMMSEACDKAQDDSKFLDDSNSTQQHDREQGEKEIKDQQGDVRKAKIKFKH